MVTMSEFLTEKEYTFRVLPIFYQVALDAGVLLDVNRVEFDTWRDYSLMEMMRGILRIATQEEEVFKYPENFWTRLGQRWQRAKEKTRVLRVLMPLRWKYVWAIHKFPELNLPDDLVVGKEFVHFRIVDEKKLEDWVEGREKKEG